LFDDDWIKVKNKNKKKHSAFSFSKKNKSIFGEELALAWNISNFISVNFNVFENQSRNDYTYLNSRTSSSNIAANKSFSKFSPIAQTTSDSYRIAGYKFGLSSKLGLGRNYKLDINFDYGVLDGADLIGFKNSAINTSSFALGIRKNKFGASLNTDIFIENSLDANANSRLGFELDWHFSDETTLSFGSKQRINSNLLNSQSNSLESLTGDIQYIKFKHNL